MNTAGLFDQPIPAAAISGAAFDPERDAERLLRQVDCVRDVALAAGWVSIQKLTVALRKKYPTVGFPENSVQAQLRNLRKVGYVVERRYMGNGLFEYRLLVGKEARGV